MVRFHFSVCFQCYKNRKTTNCNPEEKTQEVPEAHPNQSTVKNSYFVEERESAWVKSRHFFFKKKLKKNEALATPPPLNLKTFETSDTFRGFQEDFGRYVFYFIFPLHFELRQF